MKALFAGSFDPFTIGHLSIVRRVLKLTDELVIGVGYNENKKYEWDTDKRVKAINKIFKDEKKIIVTKYKGLTVEFAKEIKADVLIRGVRDVKDFETERNLADINKRIGDIDTILIISEPEYSFISSSMVRELKHNGYDYKEFIPDSFIGKQEHHE